MTKYHFYADPGHGWLKVKLSELFKLGIQDKITSCSYIRKGFVYLEEDVDAQTFLKAKQDKQEEFVIVAHHSNRESKIRNYANYINNERYL
jgi:hypothetical protein